MKNLWSIGLLSSLIFSSCLSGAVPVREPEGNGPAEPAPEVILLPIGEDPVPAPSPPEPLSPPAGRQATPGYFARYLITTDPPGVGVLREGGDLIGLTPLTITLDSSRPIRLTFLKKGYGIVGKFIRPEEGEQIFHLVMVADPEEPAAAP